MGFRAVACSIAFTLSLVSVVDAAEAPVAVSPAAEDLAWHQRLDALLVQLQDPFNEARASPGADLLAFPPRATAWFTAVLDARTDLTWQAQYSLHRAIQVLQSPPPIPVVPGGPPMHAAARAFYALVMKDYMREAYHDPAWDGLVSQAIQLVAMAWNLDPCYAGDTQERTRDLLQKAYALGCRDPNIEHILATSLDHLLGDDSEPGRPLFRDAGIRIRKCHYDDNITLHIIMQHLQTLLWASQGHPVGNDAHLIQVDMALLPALLARGLSEPWVTANATNYMLNKFAGFLKDLNPGHELQALDLFTAAVAAEHPTHPLAQMVRAYVMNDWAWEARGHGWASSVTEEGSRLMQERMADAQRCVQHALREDPQNACPLIVAVALANSANTPREQVWDWFLLAQAMEPGRTPVLLDLTSYLEPKWNGSADELLALGRAALATGDWTDGTPFTLITVHHTLAQYSTGTWQANEDPAYLRSDAVWKDFDTVYVGALAAYPEDQQTRSVYCYDAYRTGHIALARTQYRLIKEPCIAMFGGEDSYGFVREALFPTGGGLGP